MLFTTTIRAVASGGMSLCITEIGGKNIGGTENTIFAELMKSWRNAIFLKKQLYNPRHCKSPL